MHYSDLVSYRCTVDKSSSASNIVRFNYPSALLHTTCLEIGPELPVLETRHGIYCTLCYSITSTDHGGVGRSMKADKGGRKGDELATALYPIRSRAIISGTFLIRPKAVRRVSLATPEASEREVPAFKFRDDTSLPSPSPSDGPKFFCRHLRFSISVCQSKLLTLSDAGLGARGARRCLALASRLPHASLHACISLQLSSLLCWYSIPSL